MKGSTTESFGDISDVKGRIRAAWERGAEEYDEHYGHGLKSPQERSAWLQLLRRLLPPEEPKRVLDVGTGTGFLALLLAELGHSVTGIDLSPAMLARARSKAAKLGLSLTLQEGDADAPPFGPQSFDVVVSRHVLWTLLEPERAVRAWMGVTRAGGQVVAIDGLWFPHDPWGRAQVWAGQMLRRLAERGRQHHRDHYAGRLQRSLPMMGLRSPEPARHAFQRAGLREVRAEELKWLDVVERQQMPLHERLRNQYRRYLVEGIVPS